MSQQNHNDIYNILGKLGNLEPKVETKTTETKPLYESVEAQGSILSGVEKVEKKLAEDFDAFKAQGMAEEAPRTDTEINRQATAKYAEEIKRALENATGATVDTNLNQDGSVQIVINPRPNNRKLGYIVPNEEGVGATARNVSAAIEKYHRGFRQKGWRFDQPTQGQFTIAVPQQGVAESKEFERILKLSGLTK